MLRYFKIIKKIKYNDKENIILMYKIEENILVL